jgi:hypothetical protein
MRNLSNSFYVSSGSGGPLARQLAQAFSLFSWVSLGSCSGGSLARPDEGRHPCFSLRRPETHLRVYPELRRIRVDSSGLQTTDYRLQTLLHRRAGDSRSGLHRSRNQKRGIPRHCRPLRLRQIHSPRHPRPARFAHGRELLPQRPARLQPQAQRPFAHSQSRNRFHLPGLQPHRRSHRL